MKVSAFLISKITEKNTTIYKVAKETKISHTALHSWCLGNALPNFKNFVIVCRALNVSDKDILSFFKNVTF